MSAWGVVLALHILSAVLWVGGMFFALIILRPSLGVLAPPDRPRLHAAVFRRLFLVIWHAMPIALVTGYAMLFGIYNGFAGADWSVNLMQLFGLVMAAIFLVIFFGPWPAFRRSPESPGAGAALGRIRLLVAVSLVLGLLTVAVAALGWR